MSARRKKPRRSRDDSSSDKTASGKPETTVAGQDRPKRRASRLVLLALLAGIACVLWIWSLSGKWVDDGEAAIRLHRFGDARQAFRRASHVPLRGGVAWMGMARAAWMSGDLTMAEESLVAARSKGATEDQITRERQLIQIRQGAAVELRPELPEMLRRTTNEEGPVILEAFVAGFLNRGQTDGAAEILAAWKDAAPDDPRLYFWRGVVMQSEGRNHDAIESQRKALSLAPRMTVARLAIAEPYRQSEYYREAIPIYRTVLADQPNNAIARLGLAICQLHGEDQAEGTRQLEGYLEDYPDDNEARLALAAHYQDTRQSEKVIATLAPITATGEQQASSDYMNAVAHHRLGRADQSDQAFGRFQQFNRSSSQIQLWTRSYDLNPTGETARSIAMAMTQVDRSLAGQWILKALTHTPDDTDLNRMMADWLRELGREDAAKLYDQRAAARPTEN